MLLRFTTIGAVIFFAVAVSEVLIKLSLSNNISFLTEVADTPAWLTLLLIGVSITIIAGPLTPAIILGYFPKYKNKN
ncbi:hypothetical protein GIJ44_15955 [Staphylococcus sp. KY49P]|nr:hypothetical protein [Staphylococcus sp. KY49P]